jgi:hypothetical protein
VTAAGFRTAVANDNKVSVAGTAHADVRLEIGAATERVDVRSTAALVESTTSDLGQIVDRREVSSLPLNGRIFSQLTQLVPGAVPSGGTDQPESSSGAGAQVNISATINGIGVGGSSYTIDGVFNAEPLNQYIGIAPPIEAIEEFRVQTANPSAEFGNFSGAKINLTIRSGTNSFHGALFEYLRNDDLNARSFFATSRPPFKTNELGGTFGGPIKKNKAFFFGDYQALRLRSGQSYILNVPTAAMRQGTLLAQDGFATVYDPLTATNSSGAGVTPFAGNQIPATRWDPVDAKVLGIWPQPNVVANGPVNNFIQNVSNPQSVDSFDIKGDYQFEKLGRLFVRESYSRRDYYQVPPGNQFLSANPNAFTRNHNAVIGHSVSLRPTLLNELRLSFNRFDTIDIGNDYGTNENTVLGILNGTLPAYPASSGIAGFSVGSLVGFGAPGWTDAQRLANTYEITNGTTWVKNDHTLKFGLDVRDIHSTLTNPDQSPRGQINFSRSETSNLGVGGAEYASFLLGFPDSVQRGFVNTRPDIQTFEGGLYVQDDWRISRVLTLNLGLRWEFLTPYADKYNRESNYNPITGLFTAASSGNPVPNVNTRNTDFAPRIGFAYAPRHLGGLVVRGAFGLSYFSQGGALYGGTLERNFPFFQTLSFSNPVPFQPFWQVSVNGLPNYTQAAVSASFPPIAGLTPIYVPQDLRPTAVVSTNFGVQRSLGADGVIDIAYVGTRATAIYRSYNIQTPYVPGPGPLTSREVYYSITPQISNINERGTDGSSLYNSLQMKYTHRFAKGLQALFAYTYQRSLSDTSVFWVWDDKLNWGPNAIRHVFSGSWTYDLPFGKGRKFLASGSSVLDAVAGGWGVNGIATVRSGSPLSVTSANNLLNTGTGNRANLTCSGVAYPKTVAAWFDTSCFTDPTTAYTFGNAGPGSLWGPGVVNFDLTAVKAFKIRESVRMEIRGEFFNAFNNPHFSNPNTSRSSSSFGRITGTTLIPRQIQLGAKLTF